MKVISVTNRKGGVGKTTTAQTLAKGLTLKGFKVLAIDLDSQANLTYSYGADESKEGAHALLCGEVKAQELIQNTANGDIIASSELLAILSGNTDIKLNALQHAIQPLKAHYDYIVIDTAPALDSLVMQALIASDEIIITAQADIYSIKALGQIAETVSTCKKVNSKLSIAGILLTRYNSRTAHTRDISEVAEQAAAKLGTKVFNTKVRECIALREAQTARLNIFDYSPKSNGAEDYKAFIDEFIGGIK